MLQACPKVIVSLRNPGLRERHWPVHPDLMGVKGSQFPIHIRDRFSVDAKLLNCVDMISGVLEHMILGDTARSRAGARTLIGEAIDQNIQANQMKELQHAAAPRILFANEL